MKGHLEYAVLYVGAFVLERTQIRQLKLLSGTA